MRAEHLQEIRDTPTVSPKDFEQAMYHCGLAQGHRSVLIEEIDRLRALINTPEVDNFIEGVRLEAVHQRERWGAPHAREKSAEHWFWLVGYLAGKALRSALLGDLDKARHHCISTAAALSHWHAAVSSQKRKDADLARHEEPPCRS